MTTTEKSANRNLIIVASAVIVAAFAFLVGSAVLGGSSDPFQLESSDFGTTNASIASIPDGFGGLQVGEPVAEFTLLDTYSNTVSLSDYEGQPILINFWATWCAPCRIEMPEFQAAYEKHKDEGFVILALDQDESAETVNQYFYDEMNLTFTPLLDTNNVIAAKYGVYGFNPSSFFIDRDGIIAARHIGPLTASQLDAYLTEILPSE